MVSIYTGFCNDSQVIIGDNVAIGLDTCITTNSHMIGNSNQRWGENTSKSVTVEDGVWIGANVTVLQGVTIGRGEKKSPQARWSLAQQSQMHYMQGYQREKSKV